MKILHVLRSPVGGLFRHVVDLASGQIARGHHVGVIADRRASTARSEAVLAQLAPKLSLGLSRIHLQRQPSPFDIAALWHVARRIRETGAAVVHGHGAKGGALARLAPGPRDMLRVYTPHGGSLHNAVGGRFHLLLEKALMGRGNLYLFESAYSQQAYLKKVGRPDCAMRIIHNGVGVEEFEPIATDENASDVVFLGELRMLKGVDVLIDAIARLRAGGRRLTATIVGEGPDSAVFHAQVARLGLSDAVRFCGAMPARLALASGRVCVMPSRAESLPYVVLEAAAAARPLIATHVGGIPEIFGPLASRLVPPGDTQALTQALIDRLDNPAGAKQIATQLQSRIRSEFSIDAMVDKILAAYQDGLRAIRQTDGQDRQRELRFPDVPSCLESGDKVESSPR